MMMEIEVCCDESCWRNGGGGEDPEEKRSGGSP